MSKFYYLESLENIELDGKKSWLNIHRVGEWKHPTYGKVVGSIKKFQKMIENFENKVIGRDVSMDTRHSHGEALAWVEKLKIVGEKLMALVSWTPLGEKSVLKERLWRYISPEYDENYEDKETGRKHGPALLGIASTNFPFLTNLDPMILSEDLERNEELSELIAKPSGPRKIERKPVKSFTLTDKQLEILNSIKEYAWREIQEADEDEVANLLNDVNGPLNIPQKRMIAKLQQVVYLPYPNFFSCRLKDPKLFQKGKGNWATVSRTSGGKQYNIIMGRLIGKTAMTEQAYRYSRDTWTSSEASGHCDRHDGNFNA